MVEGPGCMGMVQQFLANGVQLHLDSGPHWNGCHTIHLHSHEHA